jgi:hypothetical protein
MTDPDKNLKKILKAKLSFWHLFVGLVLCSFYILLICFSQIIYVGIFGAGASSESQNHLVAMAIISISPLLIMLSVYTFLSFRSFKLDKFSEVKFYVIIALMTILLYVIQSFLF